MSFSISRYLDDSLRDLIRGISVAFVVRAFGAGLGFAFSVIVARTLGAEGAGVFALGITCLSIASLVGRIGLDNALLRLIAQKFSAKTGYSRNIYRYVTRIAAIGCTITAVGLFVLAPTIAEYAFDEPRLVTLLRILAFAVVPLGLSNLQAEALKAAQRPGWGTFIQAVSIPAVASVTLLVATSFAPTLLTVAVIYLMATAFAMSTGHFLFHAAVPSEPSSAHLVGHLDFQYIRRLVMPFYGIAVLGLIMSATDIFLLGYFKDSSTVGIYSAAATTVGMVNLILIATNTVAAPQFASLHAGGDIVSLTRLARRGSALGLITATPPLLLFVLFPESILQIFGSEFIAASGALALLAVGQFINVATGSVGFLLMMTGHEKSVRKINAFVVFLNVCLNAALIPPFGILGAAGATAISVSTLNILGWYLVQKKLAILILPRL